MIRFLLACAGVCALLSPAVSTQAFGGPPPPPVSWEQRLGEELPLEATFLDHDGEEVALGDCFGDRPVILALVYYECPMLCNLVLDGLVRALDEVAFDAGDDFEVVVVSIDPGETPELARGRRDHYLEAYGRAGTEDAWTFLIGDDDTIRALTRAVGYGYTYVPETDEYAHPAGVTVVTPEGRISRVLFGADFEPRDMRLALVEASEGAIGSAVDAVLLRCFFYDPAKGRYGFAIMSSLRILGVVTVLVLGGFVTRMLLRDRRRQPVEGAA